MALLDRRDSSNYVNGIPAVDKVVKKRKYVKVDYETRTRLIVRVLFEGRSIRKAAKEMGMNFSTAKAIIKIFREEGRILKKAEQGDYDASYKTFEKNVYRLLHQQRNAERKQSKDDENSASTKIITQLKALLQEKAKSQPKPAPPKEETQPPIEAKIPELPVHQGFKPFHKPAPSQMGDNTHLPSLVPSATPNSGFQNILFLNAVKEKLQNEIQQQLFYKTLSVFQNRLPMFPPPVMQSSYTTYQPFNFSNLGFNKTC